MKKQNHQAATYIAAQTVAVVAILAGVADIVLRLLGFESVIATDIKLNSVLMLFGVAVGFLVELVRKQEELSESFKELSKRSLIAQLRTSDVSFRRGCAHSRDDYAAACCSSVAPSISASAAS